jgi:hydroxymethylbilane synthase
VRRRAQLANLRPDLTFAGLRGNIGTRLDKAAGFGAIVVAHAALVRLDRVDAVAEVLEPDLMLPQVAQGALAVECRSGDDATLERLAAIEHRDSRVAVDAERAFLAELGGGCDLPVGAYATVDGEVITLEALIASLDGHLVVRDVETGSDPHRIGVALAGRLLDGAGTRSLFLAPG